MMPKNENLLDCPCYTNCSDGCPCSYESTFCPHPDDVYFYVMEPAIYAKVDAFSRSFFSFLYPVIYGHVRGQSGPETDWSDLVRDSENFVGLSPLLDRTILVRGSLIVPLLSKQYLKNISSNTN